MAFQIKDFSSIAASILNYAKAIQTKITDFSVGSVARTILEAPAVEIEELYQQMWIGLKESIPVAIYNSFDFARQAARSATGTVRLTLTPPSATLLIPAGTTFAADGYSIMFRSLTDVSVSAGASSADVYVAAVTAGAAGNVIAGTTFVLTPKPDGLVSAVALSSFTSGADEESDAQRKARFISFIQTMNRGTVAALKYGLSLATVEDAYGETVERVRHKNVIEPYLTDVLQPVGLVHCYIHNGESGASTALLDRATEIIHGYTDAGGTVVPGWKSAGVKVTIEAATSVSVNVSGSLTVASGYVDTLVSSAVNSAISDYLDSLDIGEDVILAEIIAAAMGVDGVVNVSIAAPLGDVAITDVQKVIPGVVNVGGVA